MIRLCQSVKQHGTNAPNIFRGQPETRQTAGVTPPRCVIATSLDAGAGKLCSASAQIASLNRDYDIHFIKFCLVV